MIVTVVDTYFRPTSKTSVHVLLTPSIRNSFRVWTVQEFHYEVSSRSSVRRSPPRATSGPLYTEVSLGKGLRVKGIVTRGLVC